MKYLSKIWYLVISPGHLAVFIYRIQYWFWNRKFMRISKLLHIFNRFITGIEIESGAVIGKNFTIWHGIGTVIGDSAIIGDDVTIYQQVTLGASGAMLQAKIHKDDGRAHPKLEDKVTVYAGAKIVGPVTIGRHASVGANAVITKDIPKGAVVVGYSKILKIDESVL